MFQPDQEAAASFAPLRPRLTRIAYRMLGSVAEAEDVVQDAFLRWHQTDRAVVVNPEAWLVRAVGRLCLDVLKSARMKRETYIGPWLPDPVVEIPEDDSDDITLTLMLALERLSPLERAAYAGNWQAVPAPTCARRDHAIRWPKIAAGISPTRFSPPRAMAI